jgi:hypothetical protein
VKKKEEEEEEEEYHTQFRMVHEENELDKDQAQAPDIH